MPVRLRVYAVVIERPCAGAAAGVHQPRRGQVPPLARQLGRRDRDIGYGDVETPAPCDPDER
jgi:hypothetical protein